MSRTITSQIQIITIDENQYKAITFRASAVQAGSASLFAFLPTKNKLYIWDGRPSWRELPMSRLPTKWKKVMLKAWFASIDGT